MSWPTDLSTGWRDLATQLRDLGAEAQACTLEWCASELEAHVRERDLEALTLDEAAEESGYSRSSFERWLREGDIENAGSCGSPRVLRRHLPKKPGGDGITAATDKDLPDVAEEILSGFAD